MTAPSTQISTLILKEDYPRYQLRRNISIDHIFNNSPQKSQLSKNEPCTPEVLENHDTYLMNSLSHDTKFRSAMEMASMKEYRDAVHSYIAHNMIPQQFQSSRIGKITHKFLHDPVFRNRIIRIITLTSIAGLGTFGVFLFPLGVSIGIGDITMLATAILSLFSHFKSESFDGVLKKFKESLLHKNRVPSSTIPPHLKYDRKTKRSDP